MENKLWYLLEFQLIGYIGFPTNPDKLNYMKSFWREVHIIYLPILILKYLDVTRGGLRRITACFLGIIFLSLRTYRRWNEQAIVHLEYILREKFSANLGKWRLLEAGAMCAIICRTFFCSHICIYICTCTRIYMYENFFIYYRFRIIIPRLSHKKREVENQKSTLKRFYFFLIPINSRHRTAPIPSCFVMRGRWALKCNTI